ncbi:MAG TPA: hypothetical protein VN025_17395 [Candidatus Dormibacteraeota bacterium]|jgi:hypothetical protein|nr:hypothetical protein [Candidatus Dormibacteraeota bacterium]
MSTGTPASAAPNPVPSTLLVRHKQSTLVTLTILVIAGEAVALAGYFFWHKDNPELAKAFGEAAAALIFGAMLGAVVQVLFNDLELRRGLRAQQVEFIANVLSDLKSVYDRVESARSTILAHRSAKTYDEQLLSLLEFRVKLHNVTRAIKFDPRGVVLKGIRENVDKMRSYLDVIVKEFEANYRDISRMQNLYEAKMKAALEKLKDSSQPALELPQNIPWEAIEKLPSIANWLTRDTQNKPDFERDFIAPLDAASGELRRQLILAQS